VQIKTLDAQADYKMKDVKYDIDEAEKLLVALLKSNKRDRVDEVRFARAAISGFQKRIVTSLIKQFCNAILSNVYTFRTLPAASPEGQNLREYAESISVGSKLIDLPEAGRFQQSMKSYYGEDFQKLEAMEHLHPDIRTLWRMPDETSINLYLYHIHKKHGIPLETISTRLSFLSFVDDR
jgi:hypothetical protein